MSMNDHEVDTCLQRYQNQLPRAWRFTFYPEDSSSAAPEQGAETAVTKARLEVSDKEQNYLSVEFVTDIAQLEVAAQRLLFYARKAQGDAAYGDLGGAAKPLTLPDHSENW